MLKKGKWQNLPVEEEKLHSTSTNGKSTNIVRGTIPFMSLPYNPELRARARALRKAGMLHEALLWKRLKNRQFHGLDFDRQKIIGNYIVDFFCASELLVIEIDGCSHDNKVAYDKIREEYLLSLGLRVLHIRATEVLQNMDGVMYRLRAQVITASNFIAEDGLGE